MLIGRSKPIESLTPRGGVVVYKNISSEIDAIVISDEFKDCVIFKVLPVDIICIAVYIPPSCSKYSTPEYMDNLQLFISNFKDTPTYIMGDLNSRFGDISCFDESVVYKKNPDRNINANGRKLRIILHEEKSFKLVNGCMHNDIQFDSDFTFFRGNLSSQNDIILTNSLNMISSFKILEKSSYSDHKPISITISSKVKLNLNFVNACASDTFKYNHYDVNRKLVKTIKLSQLDLNSISVSMENTAAKINSTIYNNPEMDINDICSFVTNEIYRTCKENRTKKNDRRKVNILSNENCTSKNYHAIANANFLRYEQLLLEGKDECEYRIYRDTWIEANDLANKYEDQEYNTQANETWTNNAKNDGRKLWETIDWTGKSVKRKQEEIPPGTITRYFKSIFQSKKTVNNPTLEAIQQPLNQIFVKDLDEMISAEEVDNSIRNIGKGTSLDGISPEILKILPLSIRKILCYLYNKVFDDKYPRNWQQQLLFPYPKKGHKLSEPKLRGIAIAPSLSRVYDKILNRRFCKWFVPNKEQAGFRKNQGCLLQIFSIYLLLELGKSINDELYIAFMDYEKAFDFLNRKTLIEKLQMKNAGKKFVKSIYDMYKSTSYTPKISNLLLGERIHTDYGVTQGKESSANLYSFYVSDMSDYLIDYNSDFMDPLNLCQLADDTATFASSIHSLAKKLKSLFKFSENNYQIANISKTKYLHLSNNPTTDPIEINNDEFVESAHEYGYKYLGTLVISSKNINEHVIANLNDRKKQIFKFYAWLQYNEDTPIKVKLLVLYNCMFSSLLYGAETWADLDHTVKEDLLATERKALKRCLGVKNNTPTNMIYIELNRPDIIAIIRDRQYKFFQKILSLSKDEATVSNILEKCEQLEIVKYYRNLKNDNAINDLRQRKEDQLNDVNTYAERYNNLTELKYSHTLYETYMREDIRIIITRWRMSCLKLQIETGRYNGTPRNLRLCFFCDVLEDEKHAIYICAAYNSIRVKNRNLLMENPSLQQFLNPRDKFTAIKVGNFLKTLEETRKNLLK